MRWDRLFADLEGQLAAGERRELDDEVAERTRRERALVPLAERLASAFGSEVVLGLVGGVRVSGVRVRDFTRFGVVVYNAVDATVADTDVTNSTLWGFAAFTVQTVRFQGDGSHGNGEGGFYLGDSAEVTFDQLKEAVDVLLDDPMERKTMTRCARNTFDGRGPDRIVNGMEIMLHSPARKRVATAVPLKIAA